MKYEELNILGKLWYFILVIPVVTFVVLLTALVATFALFTKIAKVSKLLDALSVWAKILGDGFTKKVKNAAVRKKD